MSFSVQHNDSQERLTLPPAAYSADPQNRVRGRDIGDGQFADQANRPTRKSVNTRQNLERGESSQPRNLATYTPQHNLAPEQPRALPMQNVTASLEPATSPAHGTSRSSRYWSNFTTMVNSVSEPASKVYHNSLNSVGKAIEGHTPQVIKKLIPTPVANFVKNNGHAIAATAGLVGVAALGAASANLGEKRYVKNDELGSKVAEAVFAGFSGAFMGVELGKAIPGVKNNLKGWGTFQAVAGGVSALAGAVTLQQNASSAANGLYVARQTVKSLVGGTGALTFGAPFLANGLNNIARSKASNEAAGNAESSVHQPDLELGTVNSSRMPDGHQVPQSDEHYFQPTHTAREVV